MGFEFLDNQTLCLACIHAEEREGDPVEQMQIVGVQRHGMSDDPPVHP